MYVDDENKVIVMCPPRTGTRTVRDVLVDQYGFVAVDNHHSSVASTPNDRWPGTGSYFQRLSTEDGWTVGCFVRNHFDRMASWWRLTEENRMPDPDPSHEDTAIMMRKMLAHTRHLKMSNGNPQGFMYHPWTCYATHVLRYEHFERDLRLFLEVGEYPVSGLVIPHVGKIDASGTDYQLYFNHRTRQKMEQLCGYEMRQYGYQW